MNRLQLKERCVDYVIDNEYKYLRDWIKENTKPREGKRAFYSSCTCHILWDVFEYKYGRRERDRRFWEEYRDVYPTFRGE